MYQYNTKKMFLDQMLQLIDPLVGVGGHGVYWNKM